MFNKRFYLKSVSLLLIFLLIPFFSNTFAKDKNEKAKKNEKLLTRIDFGNSYITGQTLKSGAVYLLQRKKNEIKTMLEYRENYRKEIMDEYGLLEPVKQDNN